MRYQTMRVDHINHLNIEDIIGSVELSVCVDTLTIRRKVEEEKPRTKVEYVKCEFDSMWEAVKAFEGGEVFHTHFMTDGWVIVEHVQQVIPNLQVEKLYRRIETPMTEREAFVEAALNALDANNDGITETMASMLFDSGKFKLVS